MESSIPVDLLYLYLVGPWTMGRLGAPTLFSGKLMPTFWLPRCPWYPGELVSGPPCVPKPAYAWVPLIKWHRTTHTVRFSTEKMLFWIRSWLNPQMRNPQILRANLYISWKKKKICLSVDPPSSNLCFQGSTVKLIFLFSLILKCLSSCIDTKKAWNAWILLCPFSVGEALFPANQGCHLWLNFLSVFPRCSNCPH